MARAPLRLALLALLVLVRPGEAAPREPEPRLPASRTAPPARKGRPVAEASVRALLAAAEPEAREQAWRALGPEVVPVLGRISTQPGAALRERTRAVVAMGVVGHPEAGGVLRRLAEDQALPVPLRAAAALSLSRSLGREAVRVLRPLLWDRAGEVRAAAARALGTVGGEEARAALEEALVEETEGAFREVFQRELSRMVL